MTIEKQNQEKTNLIILIPIDVYNINDMMNPFILVNICINDMMDSLIISKRIQPMIIEKLVYPYIGYG